MADDFGVARTVTPLRIAAIRYEMDTTLHQTIEIKAKA